MKTNNYFLMILSVILLASCEKEEVLTNDEALKQKLVGSWEGYSTTYIFSDNNKYTYSHFHTEDSVIYTINGDYHISNGDLVLENLKLSYHWEEKNTIESYIYTYPRSRIQLTNDELILTHTRNFTPTQVENLNNLYGKWSSDMFISVYDSRQDPYYFDGIQSSEIEFLPDTNICNMAITYKYGHKEYTDIFDSTIYDYDSTNLIISGIRSVVSFSEDKMIWEEKVSIYKRIE